MSLNPNSSEIIDVMDDCTACIDMIIEVFKCSFMYILPFDFKYWVALYIVCLRPSTIAHCAFAPQ